MAHGFHQTEFFTRLSHVCVCVITAVTLALVPVGGYCQEPTSRTLSPRAYHEAPQLADLVRQGKLPPVAERLPISPLVIQPVDSIGKYGGTWRMLASAPGDLQLNARLGYEPLIRWDRSGRKIVPNVVESYEVKDGARSFIFHLRKGMRWSDGVPFTSADFLFSFHEVIENRDLVPNVAGWLKSAGNIPTIEAPDDFTVVYHFQKPYGLFPQVLASVSSQRDLYCPAHYMKQFHAKYQPIEDLRRQAKILGLPDWTDLFDDHSDLDKNPDLPTLGPFKVTVTFPNSRCMAVRNPYYWKIDPAGNQLPYIDEMAYITVFDNTVLNLKAMNGEVDFQMRHIDSSNFTLFKENGPRWGYDVRQMKSTNPICIYVNQCSRDDKLRAILQDKRFRVALAAAINREELIDLVYTGLAEPSNAVDTEEDPYFEPGLDKTNIKYDPQLANKLLDEVGLKRGLGGMRTLPDGTPFSQILHIFQSEEGTNAEMWELVADYWREVGLQFSVKFEDGSLSYLQVSSGNSDFWTYTSAGLHWAIEGLWKVPLQSVSYFAPLYGLYTQTAGRKGVKPSEEHQRLLDWYQTLRSAEKDEDRIESGHKILRQWQDQCYVIGICRPPLLGIVSHRFRNVPQNLVYDYRLRSPGYTAIEQYYIDEEAISK